jgi:hypothetical protein
MEKKIVTIKLLNKDYNILKIEGIFNFLIFLNYLKDIKNYNYAFRNVKKL